MTWRTAGIVVFLLTVCVLAYLVIRPKEDKWVNENPPLFSQSSQSAGDTVTTPQTNLANDEKKFNYVPEEPEAGQLRGIVEIGATGFNSYVVNMDNRNKWKMVSKDFGESLAYEGLATTEDIREGLKRYLSSMFDRGVSSRNMHFVVSSGALKSTKTVALSRELRNQGYPIKDISPEEEARLGFWCAVPPSFTSHSFMVDIGSGNTKVAWEEEGEMKTLELPGSKYYEKGKTDQEVYEEVVRKIRTVPQAKRHYCFVIGGVPSMMARQHNSDERYIVLKKPGAYEPKDKRMASGMNIYKGIYDVSASSVFVFDWDGFFPVGYLLRMRK